ncbi:unnamed protein product [Gongylonema pulchrum]|uniref:ABC transmembrane type-1 domain-containing protein n=1 Tax=Gongylonema pulchrum TaxID=637853 RepID=A0A183E4V4_9BILA|nr:unnamed protein product [Gongylonema pulchrum]
MSGQIRVNSASVLIILAPLTAIWQNCMSTFFLISVPILSRTLYHCAVKLSKAPSSYWLTTVARFDCEKGVLERTLENLLSAITVGVLLVVDVVGVVLAVTGVVVLGVVALVILAGVVAVNAIADVVVAVAAVSVFLVIVEAAVLDVAAAVVLTAVAGIVVVTSVEDFVVVFAAVDVLVVDVVGVVPVVAVVCVIVDDVLGVVWVVIEVVVVSGEFVVSWFSSPLRDFAMIGGHVVTIGSDVVGLDADIMISGGDIASVISWILSTSCSLFFRNGVRRKAKIDASIQQGIRTAPEECDIL